MDYIQKENRTHSSEFILFSYYESRIPEYFPNVPLHWHGEIELNYMLAGACEFHCGGKKYIARKGDIVVVMPDILHAVYPTEGESAYYDTLVVNIKMIGLSNNDRSTLRYFEPIKGGSLTTHPIISPTESFYNEIQQNVEMIFHYAKRNTEAADLMLRAELLRFLYILIENDRLTEVKKRRFPEIVRSALEYISANLEQDITIHDLAKNSHISESYFMNCFKSTVGVSAVTYINQLRIQRVCELLHSPNISISEAAFRSGFSNMANFNRQFLKQTGVTPKEYRVRIDVR